MNTQVHNKNYFDQTFAVNEIKHIADAIHEAVTDTTERHRWNANRYDINLRQLAMYFAEGYRYTGNIVYDTVAGMLNYISKSSAWATVRVLDKLDTPEFIELLKRTAADIQFVHDKAVSELA